MQNLLSQTPKIREVYIMIAMETKQPTTKRLTRKQKAFVKHLIDNPKASATQAVVATYDETTLNSAAAIASENLRKPNIVSELAKHSVTIENTLIDTVKDYATSNKLGYRTLAVDTAKYIHDKIHGKATQRLEHSGTVVKISLDLTGKQQ